MQYDKSPTKYIGDFSIHVEVKVFSKTCNESTGGSDTPAKYMTDNLLQNENEEQLHTHV